MVQFKSLSKLDRKTRLALVNLLECSLEGAARLLEEAELKASTSWDSVRPTLARASGEAVVRLPSVSRLISSSSGHEG